MVYEKVMAIRYAPKLAEPAKPKAPAKPKKNKGGRPRKAKVLVSVTLRLDPDVLESWKALGPDWRARMAEAVRV